MLTVKGYFTLLVVDKVIKVDFGSGKGVSFDTIMTNLENLSLSRTLHLEKPVEVFHNYGNQNEFMLRKKHWNQS